MFSHIKWVLQRWVNCRSFGAMSLLSLLASAGWAAPRYSILDLGTLDGGASYAAAINTSGQVAGQASIGSNATHAFLFNGHATVDLGTLGGTSSAATALNDIGQVVGYSYTTGNSTYRGFISDGATMSEVGTFGGQNSKAFGINNKGEVVGYANIDSSSLATHGFLYKNGLLTDLGTLGGSGSTANAINDKSEIVGGADTAPYDLTRAFSYKHGSMTEIAGLTSDTYCAGVAINSLGQIAGGCDTSGFGSHAFLYTGGTTYDLGALAYGATSFAAAINNHGDVVGFSQTETPDPDNPPTPRAGFLYRNGQMFDLNSLIDATGEWHIEAAVGINDSGQIAANGCHPVLGCHALRLDLVSSVPEPSTAILCVTGLAILWAPSRRRGQACRGETRA